jgi:hypothetical protein
MENRGEEFQRWGNLINEVVLQQTHGQEYFFVTGNKPNEIDEILGHLINANAILETMITANVGTTAPVELSLPDSVADWIEFDELYGQWQASRKKISSIAGDITRNPFYFRIVGMGRRALPFIFSRLENETKAGQPDHWFPALQAITGADPVPFEDRGKIKKMAHAWLEWATREGYLYAQSMGERISQSR